MENIQQIWESRMILALGRMMFGKSVTNRTCVLEMPPDSIIPYDSALLKSPPYGRLVEVTLERFDFKSEKRELSVKMGYDEGIDTLFIKITSVV